MRQIPSIPRPPVKRHTIFCHACPSPALLSTTCAIVINKNLNNKTEKTRGLPCLAPTSVPFVLFRTCYESFFHLKIRRFQDFCYVAPPFEECCTSSTSSDAVRVASSVFLQMVACFHAPYRRSNIVFCA